MEESVKLLDQIQKTFDCECKDVRACSSLSLAYLGDAVYDLIIRTVVTERANQAVDQLHKKTIQYVSATAQARIIEGLMEELSEDESAVYRRGRNAKSYSTARNASLNDYRKATGFEALIGYLYLAGRTDRIMELVKKGIAAAELTI